MDAKRDAEFEAEISLFEDHKADIPDPILSAQITHLFRWRNQTITRFDPSSMSVIAIRHLTNQPPTGEQAISLTTPT
jgi:hypothetical protein